MAEATLNDVIDQLREEGKLTRKDDVHSLFSLKDTFVESFSQQADILKELLGVIKDQAEETARQAALDKAGKTVTDPEDTTKTDNKAKKEVEESGNSLLLALGSLKGLGKTITLLAVGIGASLGIVTAQFRAIATFFPKTSAEIIKSLTTFTSNFSNSISNFITSFRTTISNINNSIARTFGQFSSWISSLLSTARSGINRLGLIGRAFTGAISGIVGTLQSVSNVFMGMVRTISGAVTSGVNIVSRFQGVFDLLKSFGSAVGRIAGVVGRIFAPLTVVITLFETIRGAIDGYTEGGILGAFQGAIDGFFTTLITKPLDFVKDMVAWVIGKLGFNETADMLREFSFTDLFRQIISSVFDGVRGAVNVIKDLFTFGEEDKTALGLLGKLQDLVYAPVNMAINYVRGIFGFGEDDEPFRLQDFIREKISSIIGSIAQIFSFIPSISDIRDSFLDRMPNWMRKLVGAPDDGGLTEREIAEQGLDALRRERQAMIDSAEMAAATSGVFIAPDTSGIDQQISNLQSTIENMPEYNSGTKGFMDFGMGTPAMLHGIEAVVPRQTPAGEFLAANFDDNFQPIMDRISGVESAAMAAVAQAPIIITNAPTVAPITNNIGGSTNVSSQRINAMGTGNGGSGLGRFAN